MHYRYILGAALLACALWQPSTEASGYFPMTKDVVAHESPDGSLSFATGPDVPLTKVFGKDGASPAYYFRFWAQNRRIGKQQGLIHARLFADGQDVKLEPVGKEADMHAANVFCGSYRVTEEDLQQAAHATSYEFQLVDEAGNVLWKQQGKAKTAEAFQKVLVMTPASYLREGVVRDEKAVDSVRRDSRPRVFLPSVTPNEVQAWLFLHQQALLQDKLGKEFWGDYRFYYHKAHDDIVFFMGNRPIGNGLPLITFETRPYAGGTMLAMMKDQILEDRYWHTDRTVGMMTADDDIVSMTSVWRDLDDQWDGFLSDAYEAFQPYADFGFVLDSTHKKGEGNRFFVTKVSEDVTSLSPNEELLALDGEDLAWYKPNELRLKLLQHREAARLRLRTAAGEECEVELAPILNPPKGAAGLPQDRIRFFEAHKIKGSGEPVVDAGNYPVLFSQADSTYAQPSSREIYEASRESTKSAHEGKAAATQSSAPAASAKKAAH